LPTLKTTNQRDAHASPVATSDPDDEPEPSLPVVQGLPAAEWTEAMAEALMANPPPTRAIRTVGRECHPMVAANRYELPGENAALLKGHQGHRGHVRQTNLSADGEMVGGSVRASPHRGPIAPTI
jgi:hypothetical protein